MNKKLPYNSFKQDDFYYYLIQELWQSLLNKKSPIYKSYCLKRFEFDIDTYDDDIEFMRDNFLNTTHVGNVLVPTNIWKGEKKIFIFYDSRRVFWKYLMRIG